MESLEIKADNARLAAAKRSVVPYERGIAELLVIFSGEAVSGEAMSSVASSGNAFLGETLSGDALFGEVPSKEGLFGGILSCEDASGGALIDDERRCGEMRILEFLAFSGEARGSSMN